MNIDHFKALPLMGILRGVKPDALSPLTEAVAASGLQAIEITMNTEGAAALIRRMVAVARGRLMVGAGTVLSLEQMHEALDAGASFIVSPVLVDEVVGYCAENRIPVFPGALTPQEIYRAWNAGATMVKVFPAKFFGPSYFKEIKGPFRDIELLACGGVSADTIASYFDCGASAAAFGGSVFRADWIEQGRFDCMTDTIIELIDALPRPSAG